MKFSISKYIGILSSLAFACMAAGLMVSCRQDGIFSSGSEDLRDVYLDFTGEMFDVTEAKTRALSQSPIPVEPNDFDVEFFVEVYDSSYQGEGDNSKFGAYKVDPSGKGGVLTYDGPIDEKLNWYNATDEHNFWSWTLPWISVDGLFTDDPNNPGAPDNIGKDRPETTDPSNGATERQPEFAKYLSDYPVRLRLRNTLFDQFYYEEHEGGKVDSTWIEGSWGNGYFLEKFIATHTVQEENSNKEYPEFHPLDYNFKVNGPEVPLQFKHLVSKIALRSLTFYAASGAQITNYQANITFINMPTEFTFYPHPNKVGKDGEIVEYTKVAGVPVNGDPIVVTDPTSANPNGGITFGFTNPADLLPKEDMDNKTQYRDKFYICPEIDFSKVSFMVEVSDQSHMQRGQYYGDFSTVVFDRTPASDYDNPNISGGERIDDSTILHAGEVMYFDLVVRESGGGGYRIYVQPWSDRTEQKTKHYPHPGIYEAGQAAELGTTSLTDSELWSSRFEMYGDGFTNDDDPENPYEGSPQWPDHLGIFHQYADIEINGKTFNVNQNFIYDGMGYELSFRNTTDESTVVTVGKMRDIYLTMGDYTIYIDPEGWICKLNATTGKYERTNQQMTPEEDACKYEIDLKTATLLSAKK